MVVFMPVCGFLVLPSGIYRALTEITIEPLSLGTQLLAPTTCAQSHPVVAQSTAVHLTYAESTLTALRALAVEYRAEIDKYGRRLYAAIVSRQRMVDVWRDAGLQDEVVIEECDRRNYLCCSSRVFG
jgi:hypothetical protein